MYLLTKLLSVRQFLYVILLLILFHVIAMALCLMVLLIMYNLRLMMNHLLLLATHRSWRVNHIHMSIHDQVTYQETLRNKVTTLLLTQ